MGRHREAVNKFLKTAQCDEVTAATLHGLADRWDIIEATQEGTGQIPQLAAVLLNTAQSCRIPVEDVLQSLELELRGMT